MTVSMEIVVLTSLLSMPIIVIHCLSPFPECCDLHGTTQWEFNDKHVPHTPCGIAIDNDGNVYVVGCRSNNVVVFPLMYNAIDNYCLPRML
jgi:DNA-binding beta-propeller fold protein YncE